MLCSAESPETEVIHNSLNRFWLQPRKLLNHVNDDLTLSMNLVLYFLVRWWVLYRNWEIHHFCSVII